MRGRVAGGLPGGASRYGRAHLEGVPPRYSGGEVPDRDVEGRFRAADRAEGAGVSLPERAMRMLTDAGEVRRAWALAA